VALRPWFARVGVLERRLVRYHKDIRLMKIQRPCGRHLFCCHLYLLVQSSVRYLMKVISDQSTLELCETVTVLCVMCTPRPDAGARSLSRARHCCELRSRSCLCAADVRRSARRLAAGTGRGRGPNSASSFLAFARRSAERYVTQTPLGAISICTTSSTSPAASRLRPCDTTSSGP
jgi:hypothetical protein